MRGPKIASIVVIMLASTPISTFSKTAAQLLNQCGGDEFEQTFCLGFAAGVAHMATRNRLAMDRATERSMMVITAQKDACIPDGVPNIKFVDAAVAMSERLPAETLDETLATDYLVLSYLNRWPCD